MILGWFLIKNMLIPKAYFRKQENMGSAGVPTIEKILLKHVKSSTFTSLHKCCWVGHIKQGVQIRREGVLRLPYKLSNTFHTATTKL